MDGIYDFRTADKLYLNHGNQADGLPRCMAVMRAAMQNDLEGNGNLFIPRKQLEGKMAAFLKKEANVNSEYLLFARGTLDETIEQLRILGAIAVDSSFGEENIYLNSSYHMETTAAENITRIWQGEKRLDCDRLGEYNKNAVKPGALDCDYLIVDEFSMVDIGLCKKLFLALNSRPHHYYWRLQSAPHCRPRRPCKCFRLYTQEIRGQTKSIPVCKRS